MKVFKMNDYDWVCAENEQQAKEYYKKEVGFDDEEIEEEFLGEVSLNDTMLVNVNDLPYEENMITQLNMRNIGGELYVPKPFSWVIENEKITKPCIIASTEFQAQNDQNYEKGDVQKNMTEQTKIKYTFRNEYGETVEMTFTMIQIEGMVGGFINHVQKELNEMGFGKPVEVHRTLLM